MRSIRYHNHVILLLIVLCAGCARELDTDLIFKDETFLLISYNPEKHKFPPAIGSVRIESGDENWNTLRAWFDTHNTYWQPDDDFSYHQVISMRGNVLQIDIHETLIRIGFNNKQGYFRQYWQGCKLEDFDFLLSRTE